MLTRARMQALFGKWHLGFYQRAFTPLARGFDEHLGYYQGYEMHLNTDRVRHCVRFVSSPPLPMNRVPESTLKLCFDSSN